MADGLRLTLDGGDVVVHLGMRTLSLWLESPPDDVRTLLLTLAGTAALGPMGRAAMARISEAQVPTPARADDAAANDAEVLSRLRKVAGRKDADSG